MRTVGDNTRDHITLGTTHPAETGLPTGDREASILRYSTRALVWGVIILVTTYLATLTVALITVGGSPFDNPTGRLFAVIGFITLHTLGGALIIIAGIQRITAPTRALTRQVATATTDLTATLERDTKLLADVIYQVGYLRRDVNAFTARIDDLTASIGALPNYGDVITDGYRLGRHSAGVGDLDQLPTTNPRPETNGFPSAAG